jgi:hypothetical protein
MSSAEPPGNHFVRTCSREHGDYTRTSHVDVLPKVF